MTDDRESGFSGPDLPDREARIAQAHAAMWAASVAGIDLEAQGNRGAVLIDPDLHSGAPVVAGTRVPVSTLVEMRADGASDGEIRDGYPTVTPQLLAAAFRWAERNGG